jgi:hypothetical protein
MQFNLNGIRFVAGNCFYVYVGNFFKRLEIAVKGDNIERKQRFMKMHPHENKTDI